MTTRLLSPRNQLVRPRGYSKPANWILDPNHPLSKGLVGFWPFGDTAQGITADISAFGRNGTTVNAPVLSGSHHGGLSISTTHGSSQYVQLNPKKIISGLSNYSISLWVKPASASSGTGGGWAFYCERGSSGNDILKLIMDDGAFPGVFQLITRDDGGSLSRCATHATVTTNWTHIVATVSGTTCLFYINGFFDGTPGTATSGSYTDATTETWLGGDKADSGSFYSGLSEGLRLYNRALSANEIALLYAEPYAGVYSQNANLGIPTAAGGITGTAAWTEAPDIWAGAGAVAIDGSAAWTEAQDIWAGVGTAVTSGSAAWTEAQDTWAGNGTVTAGITGTSAWTEAPDVWAGAGAVAIDGSGAWIEIQDIWAGAGSITLPAVTGNAAWVEAQDRWVGQGTNGAILADYDTGRKKRADKRRDKEIEEDRKRREERRKQVIATFERVIEGKIEVSEAVADEIVDAIEAKATLAPGKEYIPTSQFEAALASVANIEALWREYLERDDEEVLVLL